MGLVFNDPQGAKPVMKRLYENGVWAIFSTPDASVLQFKPGLFLTQADAEETLRCMAISVEQACNDVMFARIACLKTAGRDRSLSQKKPGFNYLLLPKDRADCQLVDALAPKGDEITIIKTTDSALTGTNLRLLLHNMDIRHVIVAGIFTDQCISSTVRSLADESFNVVVVEDCCAAATQELHRHELEIINMIYCHVVASGDITEFLAAGS